MSPREPRAVTPRPARPARAADRDPGRRPQPPGAERQRTTVRGVAASLFKALFALAAMAVFFVLFFLTPAIAAGFALLLILAVEAVRHR